MKTSNITVAQAQDMEVSLARAEELNLDLQFRITEVTEKLYSLERVRIDLNHRNKQLMKKMEDGEAEVSRYKGLLEKSEKICAEKLFEIERLDQQIMNIRSHMIITYQLCNDCSEKLISNSFDDRRRLKQYE